MSINIQGKRIQINSVSGDSFIGDKIVIGDNNIFVDNEIYPLDTPEGLVLNIIGHVDSLVANSCEINVESVRDLKVNTGSVTAKSITGNVKVNTGSVTSDMIKGNVKVNMGSINVSKVNGDLTL